MPSRKHRHAQHPPGTAPGTLKVPEGASAPVITVFGYGPDDCAEATITNVAALKDWRSRWPVVWVNVDGLGSTEVLQQLGQFFGLHDLSLEDVLNTHQRPKTENFAEDYVFVVAREAHCVNDTLELEQISLFFGTNFVLTIQETPGDSFNPVRARLREGKGKRSRFLHADYLAYALIDSIVDNYFPLIEQYNDRLDKLEDEVVEQPRRELIADTHQLKRELQIVRHALWASREMINRFGDSPALVQEETRPYLRDCYDHIIQLLDIMETARERASGLVDIYLSSISNRMNEVMKVLTIIATIFMPLSFIASVYGMNFDRTVSKWNMPELGWKFGYPYALALMLGTAFIMIFFFWRAGWIGSSEHRAQRRRAKQEPDRH